MATTIEIFKINIDNFNTLGLDQKIFLPLNTFQHLIMINPSIDLCYR